MKKNRIGKVFLKGANITFKSVLAVMLIASCLVLLNSCTYSVKVGKKCTPGSTEWSYLWFMKGESDVSKENCE
tara:strand:- start:116 stop:334 length:219 start_codon:yes stop_codon:yes gene_type:complete